MWQVYVHFSYVPLKGGLFGHVVGIFFFFVVFFFLFLFFAQLNVLFHKLSRKKGNFRGCLLIPADVILILQTWVTLLTQVETKRQSFDNHLSD